MRYCTYCGKEIMDDVVCCPNCGKELPYLEAANEKTKKAGKANKGKVIKILIAVAVALVIAVGGVFGFFFLRNYLRAETLESQLIGTTFEYADVDANYEYFLVYRISFDENGQCKTESVTHADEKVREWTGTYSVNVGFDGTQELLVDGELYPYEISVDASGEIENLLWQNWSYYPIQLDRGEDLKDWFKATQKQIEEKQFQETLEANKNAALKMFAGISYWENTGDSFNNLIPIIFKDYELTCEPVRKSNEDFIITVSGPYYFNKVNLPTLTRQGELSCRVKIGLEENSLEIIKDDGIIEAMDLYVVLSTYGSYGW